MHSPGTAPHTDSYHVRTQSYWRAGASQPSRPTHAPSGYGAPFVSKRSFDRSMKYSIDHSIRRSINRFIPSIDRFILSIDRFSRAVNLASRCLSSIGNERMVDGIMRMRTRYLGVKGCCVQRWKRFVSLPCHRTKMSLNDRL